MPFLLMLFLTFVCLPDRWPEPVWPPGGAPVTSALWTGLVMLLPALYAARLARRVVTQLDGQPANRHAIAAWYERGRFRHQLVLFSMYAVALCGLGWGWAVNETWQRNGLPLPGAEVLVLAPFFAGLVVSWCCFYVADRAAFQAAHRLVGLDPLSYAFLEPDQAGLVLSTPSKDFGNLPTYLLFQAKQKLALVFLPVALLLSLKELQRQWPAVWQEWQAAVNIAGLGIVLAVFTVMPWLIRLLLGLKPLPPGPMRDRLFTAADRLHFRCSNILLWNTNGSLANALVVGVFPWLRYVVFTDRLLEEFSPAEVESVLGHEIGHIKHHHMLYYLVFLFGSLAAIGAVVAECQPAGIRLLARATNAVGLSWPQVSAALGDHQYLQEVPLVGCIVAYILLVFGFVSRRCERQADIYGCRAVSCTRSDCWEHDGATPLAVRGRGLCPVGIRTFVGALEKVAAVNGISRDQPGLLQSWQHSTIGRRVEFLQRLLTEPTLERRFQRRVALVKWALLLVLVAALAALFASDALSF